MFFKFNMELFSKDYDICVVIIVNAPFILLFFRRKALRTPFRTHSSCTPASCRTFPRWLLGWRMSLSRWGADWPPSASATASSLTPRWDWSERSLLTDVSWIVKRAGENKRETGWIGIIQGSGKEWLSGNVCGFSVNQEVILTSQNTGAVSSPKVCQGTVENKWNTTEIKHFMMYLCKFSI